MPGPTRQRPFVFGLRMPVSRRQRLVSGAAIWALFFCFWALASADGMANDLLVPPPQEVLGALVRLFGDGFVHDVLISVGRVLAAFAMACAVAVPLGVVMGSFPAIDALFAPFFSAWRYLPAPSFIPVLLMWFGTGEAPKLALLFIGVVFFLIALISDHTRAVRPELIETALTLGAGRRTVVARVILPSVLPRIVTSMRQMLAVTWTYLVIAEIVASTSGIGAMMMRARRFLKTDEILAGILVIGLLGLAFDLAFAAAHRWFFPYLRRAR